MQSGGGEEDCSSFINYISQVVRMGFKFNQFTVDFNQLLGKLSEN